MRYAMRIPENEQTPLPEIADIAERVGRPVFHFVRLFSEQVGSSLQDYGHDITTMREASRLESVRLLSKRSFNRSRWTASHFGAGVGRQQPDTR